MQIPSPYNSRDASLSSSHPRDHVDHHLDQTEYQFFYKVHREVEQGITDGIDGQTLALYLVNLAVFALADTDELAVLEAEPKFIDEFVEACKEAYLSRFRGIPILNL